MLRQKQINRMSKPRRILHSLIDSYTHNARRCLRAGCWLTKFASSRALLPLESVSRIFPLQGFQCPSASATIRSRARDLIKSNAINYTRPSFNRPTSKKRSVSGKSFQHNPSSRAEPLCGAWREKEKKSARALGKLESCRLF